MFTGIVEAVGTVARLKSLPGNAVELAVSLPATWPPSLAAGDSVCVSGVCLTVAGVAGQTAVFQAVGETLGRSTIPQWQPGRAVNLERSLPAGGRFGGHIVAGHVDDTSLLRSLTDTGTGAEMVFALPAQVAALVAPKGSVALDGVSLTVVEVADDVFSVAVIPETLSRTTLGSLQPGARVNLEADVIARYVRRAIGMAGVPDHGIDVDFLRDHGFA
ncbi:MAG: riboflavin synthase [Planctomycetes bacterium]|nr:riboflavin synthase [Planctomycetota bacterium]